MPSAKALGVFVFALVAMSLAMAAPHSASAKPVVPSFTTLYSFCQQDSCTDGSYPESGVTVTSGGVVFGTTCYGGSEDEGVVFSITKTGAETVRANFTGANGYCPSASTLLAAGSGEYFGTTYYGGNTGEAATSGCGTVFKLSNSSGKWVLTTLYAFQVTDDGCTPLSQLVMDKKGNLYGTTYEGGNGDGSDGYGTVFELSKPKKSGGAWTETILYAFCSQEDCTDGAYPGTNLVMDKSGTLYGVAYSGGSDFDGCAGDYGCGVLFAIPPIGGESVLYNFCQLSDCADGAGPWGNLAMDAKGDLYGTTIYGGTGYYEGYESYGYYGGVIYEFSAKGQYRTLYSFCRDEPCSDGYYPYGGVTLDKTGNLYGTTYEGGADGVGVVFELIHDSALAILHSFDGDDGSYPYSTVTMDAKGNLYGTTYEGGSEDYGTVYKLTP